MGEVETYAKDQGGLGVASLYALNRALMLKWMWRFFANQDSLWTRVVKDIHGEDGNIGGEECLDANTSLEVAYLTCWFLSFMLVMFMDSQYIEASLFHGVEVALKVECSPRVVLFFRLQGTLVVVQAFA
nr:RNA-directed DNA polymerase, eukaryota, reverse transcriptase zinc-binding domain protein [Tanacetum cinerariifolium]